MHFHNCCFTTLTKVLHYFHFHPRQGLYNKNIKSLDTFYKNMHQPFTINHRLTARQVKLGRQSVLDQARVAYENARRAGRALAEPEYACLVESLDQLMGALLHTHKELSVNTGKSLVPPQHDNLSLENLLDKLPATIWTVDRDLRYTFSRGGGLGLHNLNPNEIIGYTLMQVLGSADPGHPAISGHHRALQGEKVQYTYRAGNTLWESRLEPLHDSEGSVIGVLGISFDITERIRIEEDLFQSRQMLELILNTIPQRVFWKDASLRYLGCNQPFADDAGAGSTNEISGKTDYDLIWKNKAVDYNQDDLEVMRTNQSKDNYEELIVREDGTWLWVRTTKAPLHDQSGNVIGVLGAYDDITEQKLAAEQLQKANDKLISWVEELEERDRVSTLLREMDALFQVCKTTEEAYSLIETYCPQLFPGTSGGFFILDSTRTILEASAVWGEELHSERVFPLQECWTIRRGQVHSVQGASPGLRCQHMPRGFPGDYIGFPMMAGGELFGLFHVESPLGQLSSPLSQDLVREVGDHLSLSYANLKLRETLHAQSVRDPLSSQSH